MSETPGVKKVRAFPIPASVKIGGAAYAGSIVKMTGVGFMAEINTGLVKVGDNVEVEFTLPVMKHTVACTGIVVKFFNQLAGTGGLRIAEIHFKGLSEENREKVLHYLTAAGIKA